MTSRHKLRAGQTGTGKTQSLIKEVKENAKPANRASVILDPQSGRQSLARSILPVLIGAGLWDRVIFESLSSTENYLAWQMLVPSTAESPVQREKENEDRVHAFVALLCRRKDVKGTFNLPLIEEWLTAALRMWIYQTEPVPLTWLPFCFLPDAPEAQQMIRNQRTDTHQSYLNKLKWDKELRLYARAPRSFDDHMSPSKRLIDAVFTVPFLLRCNGSWNLERALAEGKIIIVEGDPDNEDITRTILGALSLRIIQNAKDHTSPEVDVYYEEANNFGGIFGHTEAHALSTKRQCNYRAIISVQHFNFPSEEITTGVMNNCKDLVFFALGDPKTAELAALKIGVPSLDFNRVLRTTERQVRVGETETTLDGRAILKPVYDIERVDHLMPSKDQILSKQQQVMSLQPGWRFQVIDGNVKGPFYEPMEGMRWAGRLKTTFARDRMAQAERERIERMVTEMRRKPPFMNSGTLSVPWSPPPNPQIQPSGGPNSRPPSTPEAAGTVEEDDSGIKWS